MPPKQEDQEAVEYNTASHSKCEYLCTGSTQVGIATVFLKHNEESMKLQSSYFKEKKSKEKCSRQIFSKRVCNETVPAQGIFSKS